MEKASHRSRSEVKLLQRIRDLVAGWGGRLLLFLHPAIRVEGVKIILADFEAPREECVSRLADVLHVLSRRDPRRTRWLHRYVRYIVLWKGGYTFADKHGGIFLSSALLFEASSQVVSGVLVHETVHQRLRVLGIPSRPHLRARIEAACVRQQADFLRLSGVGGEQLAQETESGLLTEWWNADNEEARIRGLVDDGLPRWIATLMRTRVVEESSTAVRPDS